MVFGDESTLSSSSEDLKPEEKQPEIKIYYNKT